MFPSQFFSLKSSYRLQYIMKWISSFYASTLILLLGGSVSHVAQAKEKVGLATKLHEAKDKMCIFLKKSREDLVYPKMLERKINCDCQYCILSYYNSKHLLARDNTS